LKALESLRDVSASLENYGIKDPEREAEAIITRLLGLNRTSLYRDDPMLTSDQKEGIRKVIERRQRREPLQYITGFSDFCGLKIKVGPGVLIPRPETELIVDEVMKEISGPESRVSGKELEDCRQRPADAGVKILDLCTGSGCLALTLATKVRNSCVFGTDISQEAINYAVINAEINGITNVTFLKGDLYEPVDGLRFDLIVSNPPYIKSGEICGLDPEIRRWEPIGALDGGEDGLCFYRAILARLHDHLVKGGSLILELGFGEADEVISIVEEAGLMTVSLLRDYAGIQRILHVKRV
jgi:release factor glutamine methyltransferase